MSYGRVPILLLVLGMCSGTVSAQVYKWVDAEGNVHYGQNRPRGMEAEPVKVQPQGLSEEQRALELDKLKLKAGLGSENREPEQGEQASTQMPEAVRQENCRIARHNLAALLQKRRIVQTDEEGNLVRLDDAQRESRLQEAKNQVEEFCD